MRSVVTLAVALTVPAALPGRDLMLVAAFAVILVNVIAQRASLGWLIGRVRLVDTDPPPPMEMPEAEATITRAKLATVEAHAYADDGTLLHP